MKNFDWTQFTQKIAVKANKTTLYNAWTKSGDLEKWFLSKAIYYDSEMKAMGSGSNAIPGFFYEWRWYLYDGIETGTVIEANGTDQLQFTFAGKCIVEVTLEEVQDHVVVQLTQSEIPTDDDSKLNIRLGCASGWAFYLVNLKSVYEGGIDLRNKVPELKSMLNM
ncbi:MAG: SRPBCC domain-containing protein [Chitinophagales bacterium]